MQLNQKLVLSSILLLVALLAGSGLFVNSLERNQWVHETLIEVFQNDAKVKQDMSRGEVTVSADEFADNMVIFVEDVLMYPFYMLVFAVFLGLFGFLMMATHPSIASAFLALAGVLSLFTLVPPVLLFFAANSLVKSGGTLTAVPHRNAF
ncbi:hypothetical protein [Planococcus wigleyi]|uniref:DUF4064 domain-containing protein n=1 Tax=Planococcus wigleyi TaxID=2762216 RepID=A0ABR8WAQ2_9BACL|nr:hypothetical protein [Planococcus wigleyi]MBD8014108.1 hypothetical protein [Planococcus wigleyi]MBF6633218.1 hypothetical protein [Planococcus sp. (in: firmicutes)]